LSYNGARDWSGTSIARLAPVYGNINILAGVDRDTVLYDRGDPEINLTGDTTSTGGFVRLEGWQNVEDGAQNNANNIASPDQSGDAYVQIGHLGNGQFGSVYGDINVKAGGDIEILAGAHNDNHATIGHTLDGLVVWDPPSNLAQQVRFFHNVGDMDNPNLRKGELFVHANGTDPARGWYAENTQTDRWDDDFWDAGTAVNGTPGQSPGGPVHVEALDGSTRKTISGNIRVESYGPEGITVKAYSTPDTRTQTSDDPLSVGDLDNDGVSARADGTDDVDDVDGWRTRRDTRFAGIGHGGYNDPISSDLDNERVRLRITTGDGTGDTATSVEFTGQDNSERYNRTTTFVNIVGDIEVTAHEGGLSVIAGNDTWDYAYVGHGGRSIADYESSSVVFGDITVDVAGDIDVIGGGVLATYTGESERDFFSYAQIGHHGRESGFQYYGGDILVNAGGDINVTAGRYRESGAKIGHQTDRGFGQVGGSFNRDEEFRHSMQITEVAANLTSVAVDDSSISITMDGDTETWAIDGFTTDIEVNAGGDVLLTHSDPGVRLNQNMYALDQVTGNTDNDFNDIRWSHTQIGHGGRETGALRRNGTNAAYYYKDKTGNIAVNAGTLDATTGAVTGGNVTMQNGAGLSWWTVIGHTFGASGADRADGPDTVAGSWNLIGNIDINALGNVVLDADYADSNDMVNLLGVTGVGDPARMNFVRVGHGGGLDNLDLNTLNDGTLVNGIEGFSNITIDAGGDMEIKGGKGSFGSYAQVGHGFNSDRGNDRALPNGFNGDITVNVMGDLTLLANPRAYNETPIIAQYDFIEGGAAVIGHGGNMLEDQLNGNISVYVGNDLSITASQANQQGGIALDSNGTPIGSIYSFAKIGHWSTELDNATNRDPVDSDMTGDIVVVVGNDMTMLGGTSTDLTDFGNGNVSLPVVNAYAQVGHSAPGVNGEKVGNITVLVGNDLTTVDGDAAGPGLQPNLNNYVMIGNGDWMRDGGGVHLPANGGQGVRAGDINVLAGNNISLDHTLVGHADPRLLPTVTTILSGNTFVGASRSTPFYGGPGTLEATNGSVFTSGLYGNGTEVRFYIPQRERNLMATDTRINQAFTTYRGVGGGGVSFADDIRVFDATRNGGIDAGDPDEIYLQPDLWWNNTGLVTTVGVADPFPADLAGVQGGSLATVDAPGGLPNLVALASGSFGEGTTEYRGADLYTIYYDAIEPVSLKPATLPVTVPELPPVVVEPEPVIVPIPFDYFPFLFVDKFDSFDRDDNNLNPGFGGGLLSGVGLFALLFGDGGGSGEEGVGLQTDSEGLNTLAMLFGLPVNAEDDDEDEEKKKEREEAAHQNLGRLYGVYWQYQPFSETGHYSSNQVFGLPEINEAATTVE
ncbi:MAG: hypothetical protein H7A52_11640, partial [Akkermansiaceae bacterium]|nr:hypothetical protein [Akkermansiaceae bacterium]